ncbi:alanine racemase [Thalassotalea sp. HSM 43]|uniref:alanine racemase n=1 Tax=Thalassotalea sp. HSM 43 TaxID=2552945 RepID=UPI001080F760|nr:alanine racemase [Thalassotalea sp. HSM 43]QBY04050.1 alanine racemase [Thalassotalea sp. HSM 43]
MSNQYQQYEKCLKVAAVNSPSLFIDLDVLDANVEKVRAATYGKDLRLVVKSLPCLDLLAYLGEQLDCRRFMCFHTPFVLEILDAFENADILMGKPLPSNSVEHIIKYLAQHEQLPKLAQIQWLIDSKQRLDQLLMLGRKYNVCFKIAIEIDVGMHRGGLGEPEQLQQLQAFVNQNKKHVKLTALMGYDAHVVKAPRPFMSVEKAFAQTEQRYQQFIDALLLNGEELIFNGGGSTTHAMHQQSCTNEISVGSIFLKPTDFDLAGLRQYQCACFIATQVLKRLKGISIPFVPDKYCQWTEKYKDTLFLYGGRWLAKAVYPNLMRNYLYGLSSNQQFMMVDSKQPIDVDDFVFFRPSQSEAVLLQFGDILLLRRKNEQVRLQHRWSIMSQHKAKPLPGRMQRQRNED